MKIPAKARVAAIIGASLLGLSTCGGGSTSSPSCTKTLPPSSRLEVFYGVAMTGLLNDSLVATIDPVSGALTRLPASLAGVLLSGGIVAVSARFLYISLPATGSSPGELFGFSLDQTTGMPTPLAGSPFPLGSDSYPQGLASPPKGFFLYAADSSGSGGGRIDAFVVDSATGIPTPIAGSPFPSGTNGQLAVDPSGKFLYASDDDAPGSILAFAINSDGSLTPVPGSPFAAPAQGTANPRPYGIVDTGKFVYTALNASGGIAAFSVDSATGALAPIPGSPFPSGTRPAILAVSSSFLYASDYRDGSISGYRIDSGSGALTRLPGPLNKDADTITLAADPSGRFLYASETVGVSGYAIDPCTGTLTPTGGACCSVDGSLWMTVVQFPASASQ